MDNNMIIISNEEFYNIIGKLDVTVTPTGNYPYKTIFAYRDRTVVGYQDYDGKYYISYNKIRSN